MLSDQLDFSRPIEFSLPQDVLKLFQHHALMGKANKGREIITRSDSTTHVFYIISGRVEISTLALNTKEYVFREMNAGSIIGELAATDEGKRSVTVTAMNEVRYYKISREKFLNLILSDKDTSLWFMKFLSKRIRDLSQQVFELSSLNVRSRILLNLLRKAHAAKAETDKVVINWPKDQKKMAIKLCTHREAISREYSTLLKSGLIQKDGKDLIIPSLNKLESVLIRLMGV